MNPVNFDYESHTYTDENGLVYPSVSEIIDTGGMKGQFQAPPGLLKEAAEFGTNVHTLLELYDTDNLDSYDHQLQPWLDGWIQFKKDYPDLDNIIIDIKSGSKQKSHALQTAAYALLSEENYENGAKVEKIEEPLRSEVWAFAGTPDRVVKSGDKIQYRWAVYVDGKKHRNDKLYTIEKHEEWDDAGDHRDIFIGLIQAYHWKARYNLL